MRATQRALDRRNYVLREMARNGYITNEQREAASAAPLGTIRYGSSEKFRQQGGYFMEEVRREIIKQFGEGPDKGPNSLYAGACGSAPRWSRRCRTRPRNRFAMG